MTVRTGLQVLLQERRDLVAGERVGLISHPAAVLPDLTSSIDALRDAGVELAALFGMEHGFGGAAAGGKDQADAVDARTGLPIFSLYGASHEPAADTLAGVDLLVYDVQDVGVRFYTFISTLFYVLRSAGRYGCPLLVLNRPNPINGDAVEGPLLQPGFESFVGIARLPVRHGMTVGELARYFNEEYALGADLAVVEMQGWQSSRWFDETGLPWVPPSPAMPHLSTATVYPGTCLIEGTNVSEGRGTALPFEQVGAPWIDGFSLACALNDLDLTGVRFRPAAFEPAASKYAGRLCHGVQVHVLDRDAFRPVSLGLHLVATLSSLYPDNLRWTSRERADGEKHYTFDVLTGSDHIRKVLEDGANASVPSLLAEWAAGEAEFRERRRPYLIYS